MESVYLIEQYRAGSFFCAARSHTKFISVDGRGG
jgi:hypothetical protein